MRLARHMGVGYAFRLFYRRVIRPPVFIRNSSEIATRLGKLIVFAAELAHWKAFGHTQYEPFAGRPLSRRMRLVAGS